MSRDPTWKPTPEQSRRLTGLLACLMVGFSVTGVLLATGWLTWMAR